MDLTNSVQSSLKGHSLWVTLYIFGFVSNKRRNGRTELVQIVQSSLKGHSLWVALYIFGFVSNKRQNGRTEQVQMFDPRTILKCLPQFVNSLLKTDKSANMFIIFKKQCCPFRNSKGAVKRDFK